MMFTRDELEQLNVTQLRRLYKYYYPNTSSWKMKKEELIDEIFEIAGTFQHLPVGNQPDVQRSVRVQRIYEATLRGK